MPAFSVESQQKRATVDKRLRLVLNLAIELIDFSIIFGRRTAEEQQKLFQEGRSKLDGITKRSMHQADPPDLAKAVDIAPYPVRWPDEQGIPRGEVEHRVKRFHVLAGVILGVGHAEGIALRWGGDWDRDWEYNDQSFHDLGHFELVED